MKNLDNNVLFESENEFIAEIENTEDMTQLEHDGYNSWAFLAIYYGIAYREKYLDFKTNENRKVPFYKSKYKALQKIFYGFFNWFGSYDYFVFGDTDSKKLIDGVYKDRLTHAIVENLGPKKVLFFEKLDKSIVYSKKVLPKHNRVSYFLIPVISKIYQKMSSKKNTPLSILEKIGRKYKIDIDYSKIIHNFDIEVVIFKFICKLYQPKIIFISCYSYKSVIKAAQDLKIPVVEIRHGTTDKQHLIYDVKKRIHYTISPDYLLVYGKKQETFFKFESLYINNPDNVVAIGNYYTDYILKNKDTNILRTRYPWAKIIVAVSLQYTTAAKTIKFLELSVPSDSNILYVLIPRNETDIDTYEHTKRNIVIVNDLNCYEVVVASDYHASVYSSCVYEASALGKENIFLNILGYSAKYYLKFIQKHRCNHLMDTPEELISFLRTHNKIDKDIIIKESEEYIVHGYEENIVDTIRFLENNIED